MRFDWSEFRVEDCVVYFGGVVIGACFAHGKTWAATALYLLGTFGFMILFESLRCLRRR